MRCILLLATLAAVAIISDAWAQQSAPPASDQKVIRSWEATVRLSEQQCRLPPTLDEKSIAAFRQQAVSGDAVAQCGLGRMYSLGKGVPEDTAQAALWFRKAAEQGNAQAQCDLGLMLALDNGLRQASALGYARGSGVSQNVPQNDGALLWFRKAAEQGNAIAQFNVALLYYVGDGVPQDYAQAATWYRKAAEQGHGPAQAALAALYYKGEGVSQDYTATAFWFRKAAEQGDVNAQIALGGLYNAGQGVPQDTAQAVLWWRKAADQGNAQAQLMLGTAYGGGVGVPQDFAEAYFWLYLAAGCAWQVPCAPASGKLDASDMEQAAKLRDEHGSMLTPAAISRVQEQARKWVEAHPAKPQ